MSITEQTNNVIWASRWWLTPDERRIIDFVERVNGGRKLTQQEINLSLEQARALGEI
jgi:hypothetical protein